MKFYFDKFKDIRKMQRLSIQNIVNRLNKSYKTVWSWEKGEHKPKASDVKLLANILCVDVSEISDLTENRAFNLTLDDLSIADNEFSDQPYIQYLKNEIIRLNRQLSHQYRVTNNVNNLLDSLQSLFYTKRADLKFTYVNSAFASTLGYTKNEITGKKNHELLSYSDAIVLNELEQEVIKNCVGISNREIFIPGTEKNKYGLISIYPEYEDHKIVSLNCCIRDITERIGALKEVNKIKDLLKVYTTSMSNGLTVSTYEKNKGAIKGSFLYVNNALEKIYHYPKEKFMCKNGFDFWLNNCVHPEFRTREKDYYNNYSWPKKRKLKIICSDCSVKWIEESMSFVNYLNKKCSICEVRDITKNVAVEEININIAKALSKEGVEKSIIFSTTGIRIK